MLLRPRLVGDVLELPIDQIKVSPQNVRDENRDNRLEDLVLSIKRIGLIEPIVVFKRHGHYEVIVGQRRLLAYHLLKKEDPEKYGRIKAISIKEPEEREARLMSLVENLQRTDLTAGEKTKACTTLLRELGTVRAVSEALGWTIPTVTRWLRFDQLVPAELKELVDKKKLSQADAMKLSAATYPALDRAIEIGKAMVGRKLTDPEKARLYEVARVRPKAAVHDVIIEAKKPKEILTITFHLAGTYRAGLQRAIRERDEFDASSFAQKIVQDWLDERGYTGK